MTFQKSSTLNTVPPRLNFSGLTCGPSERTPPPWRDGEYGQHQDIARRPAQTKADKEAGRKLDIK